MPKNLIQDVLGRENPMDRDFIRFEELRRGVMGHF
jgi:hypothetical protein